MENTRKLLNEAIETGLKELESLEPGSVKTAAIDDLTKLCRADIDYMKTELEFDDKFGKRMDELEAREYDRKLREKELEEKIRDRYFRTGLEVFGIGAQLLFTGFWLRRGFKFEENGSFTSFNFRWLWNKMPFSLKK